MATPTIDAGLLLIDKPAGMTSHDVVSAVRRALHVRRAGHAGTLDPFATGLLLILFGRGTRLMPYVAGEPKGYLAVIRFGTETDTDDPTGTPTRSARPPGVGALMDAIPELTGQIQQVPPAYSAKQVGGTRAYAAARRGAALELAPVTVTVFQWVIQGFVHDRLAVHIACSGGTYIRALARDLGRLTGSAAHLETLRRTHAGRFAVTDAVPLDAVESGQAQPRPLLDAVPHLPVRRLDADELRRTLHGNAIAARDGDTQVALVDDEDMLIAVAEADGAELRPRVVLRDV